MKKKSLILLSLVTFATSFSNASTCDYEKQLISTLTEQKKIVDRELNSSAAGRNTSLYNLAGSLAYITLFASNSSGSKSFFGFAALTTAATNLVNAVVSQGSLNTYREFSQGLDSQIEKTQQYLENNQCVSGSVLIAKLGYDQHYKNLIGYRNELAKQTQILAEELGNGGVTTSNYINIASSVLLTIGSIALYKSNGTNPLGLMGAAGVFTNNAANFVSIPSVVMSKAEAREYLKIFREQLNSLNAQENLLRSLIKAQE